MAKTVFAALMQIPSVFLNKIFNHRHDGLDQDGSAPLDYAADSGAADAYVVTLSPALTQYVIGMPIRFKAGNANTSASTVNIDGLGATAIKKNVSDALVPGDITAGQIIEVVYDGTYFQLINDNQLVRLGAWEDRSINTVYQATEDGFVVAYFPNGGFSRIYCEAGDSTPDIIRVTTENDVTGAHYGYLVCPVSKNEYWEYEVSTGTGHIVFFKPLSI